MSTAAEAVKGSKSKGTSAAEVQRTNDAALELITGTCRERINEMLDDLLTYVRASEAAGSITLKISLTPEKEIPDAYELSIVPSMSVKGMRSDGTARIQRIGKQLQLTLAALDM